jgi:hypothetical protein
MFCWPYISKYACNETNLMHCLSPVYWVTIPLHVSGLLVAHHQEVTMYTCYMWQLVRVVRLSPLGEAHRQSTKTYNTYQLSHTHTHRHIYIYIYIYITLLSPDDGLLASPKRVEVLLFSKLKINTASSGFITSVVNDYHQRQSHPIIPEF